MKTQPFSTRIQTFLKNDIYTVLVALAVVFVVSGVPISAVAAEPADTNTVQSEQLITSVNINNASAPLIAASLKGVGLKKAEAIVAWRDKNGGFTSLDQLAEVKGIGVATIDKNRSRIVL